MSGELVVYKKNDVTPTGHLYMEQLSDTLHKVKCYEVHFMDGVVKSLTHQQYENFTKVLSLADPPKFVKFKDGDMFATNQIKSIRTCERIIDTRKDIL